MRVDDYQVQSVLETSPPKWHLAHVTWFFETFVALPHSERATPYHPMFQFLFNSYYVQAGERHCRAQRGYISRPTVSEVFAYRAHVDEHMRELIDRADDETMLRIHDLLELGSDHPRIKRREPKMGVHRSGAMVVITATCGRTCAVRPRISPAWVRASCAAP